MLFRSNGHYAAFKKTYAQFQVDDRHDLEVWMNANLPAGGIVAQDSPVGLPDPEHNKQKGMKREFSQTVLGSEFAADLGTLDELRAKGVRYVATTPKRSVRYTGGEMVPTATAKEEFERRKAFYTALPKQAKLLKQWLPAEIDTLHPGLELYDIGAGQ